MEANKNQFWNKAMLWGFIIALVSMLATTIYYTTDNMWSNSKSWVELGIFVIGIILCGFAYRKTLSENTEFPYSKALGLGVATAMFASLILAVFTFVLFKYIDTDLIGELITKTEETLLNSNYSDEMIEQQLEIQSKFFKPAFMSATTIFSSTLQGLLIALITSIFVKKNAANGFNAAMSEIEDED